MRFFSLRMSRRRRRLRRLNVAAAEGDDGDRRQFSARTQLMTNTDFFHDTAVASSTPSGRSRRRIRGIGAVLAGLFAIFALSTATDLALHATEVFPPFGQPMADALFVLAAAYRVLYGIAGCYVTARLAPDRPLGHALALGVVGVAISSAGAVAMWDAGPRWYALAVIAMAPPCAWLGGKLRLAQLRSSHQR
jgi:hypothetical protein